MDAQLVSVIIDNFNYERFLRRAVDSALAQTYPKVEVIVVDDGSTDGSLALLEEYRDTVTVITKENGGQASALNAGFARCNGDVVLFLDSDDELRPDAAEKVVEALRPGVAKVHYRLESVDADGTSLGVLYPPADLPLAHGWVVEQLLRDSR